MVLWFELQKEKETLKIDFLEYPYPQIDKGIIYQGIKIDSIKDIGANKLLILNLNDESKDYVDLYFILKEKFSIWESIEAVKLKFNLELDLILLGEVFLRVEKNRLPSSNDKIFNFKRIKKLFSRSSKKNW
jgi:hypothetical protein